MNSQVRKIVYFGGIVALLIPIIWLGRPSGGADSPGGKITQLRTEYDLGESDIGQVDPTSATMNLVLLGMRGIATNLLWIDVLEAKKTKNWSRARSNVETITRLQPHYLNVWDFFGWELAWNISAEWDAVPDRYYWVKEGAKFYVRGTRRNEKYPDLYFATGNVIGKKIGRADEWRQFRRFFLSDPDKKQFDGGPDPALNRDSEDNYLVAKMWYEQANVKSRINRQTKMAEAIFRQYPARSMLNYAEALQREGKFGDRSRIAWEDAYDYLKNTFGNERFATRNGEVFLEASESDVEAIAQETGADKAVIIDAIVGLQSLCNYRYWLARAQVESTPEMMEAHRLLFDGQQAFKRGEVSPRFEDGQEKPSLSEELLEDGMARYEVLLKKYPMLFREVEVIEETLMGVIYWQYIHHLNGRDLPDEYPLKSLYVREGDKVRELRQTFQRENRTG